MNSIISKFQPFRYKSRRVIQKQSCIRTFLTPCICINSLFPSMFPDSKIAKLYSSAKTKSESIIVGVLAPLSVEHFVEHVERVFSLMKSQWTDTRNLLTENTIAAILKVKFNFSMSCNEMHTFLLGREDVCKAIKGNAKYSIK